MEGLGGSSLSVQNRNFRALWSTYVLNFMAWPLNFDMSNVRLDIYT